MSRWGTMRVYPESDGRQDGPHGRSDGPDGRRNRPGRSGPRPGRYIYIKSYQKEHPRLWLWLLDVAPRKRIAALFSTIRAAMKCFVICERARLSATYIMGIFHGIASRLITCDNIRRHICVEIARL